MAWYHGFAVIISAVDNMAMRRFGASTQGKKPKDLTEEQKQVRRI